MFAEKVVEYMFREEFMEHLRRISKQIEADIVKALGDYGIDFESVSVEAGYTKTNVPLAELPALIVRVKTRFRPGCLDMVFRLKVHLGSSIADKRERYGIVINYALSTVEPTDDGFVAKLVAMPSAEFIEKMEKPE